MLARQHRAITRAWEQSSLLPFLYQTRTISRPYATGPDPTDEASDGKDASDVAPKQYDRHRHRARHEEHPGTSNNERTREFVDHVPFEGATRPHNANADLGSSTMTRRERMKFEELFKLRKTEEGEGEGGAKTQDKRATTKTRSEGQTLDDIMDAAGEATGDGLSVQPKYPQPLQRMARQAREQRMKDSKPSQSDAIAAAAGKDLAAVKKHLNNAKSDVEVWDVLQKHVFKRVTALNLDAPTTKKSKKASERQTTADTSTTSANAPAKTTKNQPPVSDLDILTQTLPYHLSATLKTLTTSFPSSPLRLTLLPHLRTLGPTAFALGTSTYLYNQHMRHLFTTSLDLDGLVDTLREMDEQVYEYDEYSEILIARVLNHARLAQRGMWGEGVRSLWEGEGMRKRVGRVFWWGKRVRRRREEEALRRARAAEEDEGRDGDEVG